MRTLPSAGLLAVVASLGCAGPSGPTPPEPAHLGDLLGRILPLLTKSPGGRPHGAFDYDWAVHAFCVTDTPEVQERIAALIGDHEGGRAATDSSQWSVGACPCAHRVGARTCCIAGCRGGPGPGRVRIALSGDERHGWIDVVVPGVPPDARRTDLDVRAAPLADVLGQIGAVAGVTFRNVPAGGHVSWTARDTPWPELVDAALNDAGGDYVAVAVDPATVQIVAAARLKASMTMRVHKMVHVRRPEPFTPDPGSSSRTR